jgi:hypothetical protein
MDKKIGKSFYGFSKKDRNGNIYINKNNVATIDMISTSETVVKMINGDIIELPHSVTQVLNIFQEGQESNS